MMVLGSSFLSLVFPATGSLTSTPFCSMGVMTMKMMSRTIMMSAMGVTLMSAMGPPRLPPTAIDMDSCSWKRGGPGGPRLPSLSASGVLLDEVVEELRARVVHLDVEALDLAVEVVERPHRGHGHEKPERGGDERLGDARGDRRDAARAREGHARERVDDAEGRPEEAHEGRGGPDGGQAAQALPEVGELHRGGALDGPLRGVHGAFLVALNLARLLLVLPLGQAVGEHLGQVRVLHVLRVGGVDGFLDLPLLQQAGDLGRVLARLLGRLLEVEVALDHHRDRV